VVETSKQYDLTLNREIKVVGHNQKPTKKYRDEKSYNEFMILEIK
jgi:hypothetical protein